MRNRPDWTATASLLLALGFIITAARAHEPDVTPAGLPIVKFFYYDAGGVEWAVSAEPDNFERHLNVNSDSRTLFDAVTEAVVNPSDVEQTALQMTRWIEQERERFDETRRESARGRMAEGIVAYLRAHDYDIHRLVEALKRRSGASQVELVVIHLVDARDTPSYKLKVQLVDPELEIGKQGFNVNLDAPAASYTVVAYALGVALYEVQELLHREDSDEGETPPVESFEPLPVPEPLEPAQSVPAALRSSATD